jgi:hypothetical protein
VSLKDHFTLILFPVGVGASNIVLLNMINIILCSLTKPVISIHSSLSVYF